jgi:diadenosine tetraphosphate (Ap4A) HIT family hydrolase
MICTLCYEYLKNDSAIIDENETCFYVEFPHEVISGWGMVMPKRHCETVFDLNEAEIADTFRLVARAKERIQKSLNPDGFNVGWNCYEVGGQDTPHSHLHIIPRFADEPLAGKGIRHWFKQKENLRPK